MESTMAIRMILKENDEMLRKISKPVTEFDDRLGVLLDDMKETMIKADGAGLAGVQVGILKRLFVMNAGKEFRECINPQILKQEGINKIKVEGCLSVPGKCGIVERPEKVWVEYQDRTGKKYSKKFTGFEAKCFCHEYDHLDGILYTDKATKMFKDRDEYNRQMSKENKEVNKGVSTGKNSKNNTSAGNKNGGAGSNFSENGGANAGNKNGTSAGNKNGVNAKNSNKNSK